MFSHSRAAGFDLDLYRKMGGVFVVRKHELHYLLPTFAGDPLEVQTWIERWRAASCIRKTRILRLSDQAVVARATTVWALVSTTTGTCHDDKINRLGRLERVAGGLNT